MQGDSLKKYTIIFSLDAEEMMTGFSKFGEFFVYNVLDKHLPQKIHPRDRSMIFRLILRRISKWERLGLECRICKTRRGILFCLEQRYQPILKRHTYSFPLYSVTSYDRVLMNFDHVIPRHHGGIGDLDNLQTTCEPCNQRKGSTHPSHHPGIPNDL